MSVAQVALERAGVDQEVTDAHLKDILSLSIELHFQGHSTGPIPLTKGLLQGCPISAPFFAATVGRLLTGVHTRWQATPHEQGLGAAFGDASRIYAIVWMDDIFLFASTAKALQTMITQAALTLAQHQHLVQPTKTQWATSAPDSSDHEVVVGGTKLERVSRSLDLVVLGSQVSLAGYAHVATSHRFGKAWETFFCNKPVLSCKHVPLAKRVALMDMTVRPAAMWGLAPVNLLTVACRLRWWPP